MKKTPLRILTSLLAATAMAVCASAYTVNLYDGETLDKTLTGADGAQCTVDNSDPALVDLANNRWLVGYRNAAGDMLVGTHFYPTGNVDLYAVWAPLDDGESGVNAFIGYDFESAGQLIRVNNGYGMIVEDPKDSTNHCFLYKRGGGWAKMIQSVKWEKGRPYRISLDILQDNNTSFCYYIGYGTGSVTTLKQVSMTANEWTHLSYDYTFNLADSNPANDFLRFYPNPGASTNDVYYDNLTFIPYNKITYDPGDGTGGPGAAYQLGGTYTVDTSTAPVRPGYTFKGWALPTASIAVSTVELGKGDVTLYAIWDRDPDAKAFAYAPATLNAGVADGKLTLDIGDSSYDGNTASLYYSAYNDKYNTPFGYMTVENGAAEYSFPAGTLLYEGIDQFVAEFPDGMSYTVDIPANKQNPDDQCIIILRDGEDVSVKYVAPGKALILPEGATRTRDAETFVGTITEYQLGWYDAESKMLAGYQMWPEHDYVLDKVWAPKETAVPGVNIYNNGDFENGDFIDVQPSNGMVTLIEEEDGNHAVRYRRGSGYASVYHYVGFEAGRTYKISFRVKTENSISVNFNPRYGGADHASFAVTTVAGKWASVEKTWTAPANYSTLSTDFITIYGNPYNGGPCDMWLDDLCVIPYAKITYDANGGTGVPAPVSIPGGDYEVDTATIPVRRGCKFVGWSTDKNATSGMDFVKAVAGDVTLYAIWEQKEAGDIFEYEYATDKRGISDGTITLMLPVDAPDYNKVTLYYADDYGFLEDYSALAELEVVDGAAVFTITGSHAFPKEATKVIAMFEGSTTAGTMTVDYIIPEERRFDIQSDRKFAFWAVSDPHCGGDYFNNVTTRKNAVADMKTLPHDFVVIAGDLVNNSNAANFAAFDSFITTNFNDAGIPTFIVAGNHEYHISDSPNANYDRADELAMYAKQLAINESQGYVINRPSEEALYYSTVISGARFIFLAIPEPIRDYTLDGAQLTFLEEELFRAEKSNEPTFVVTHAGNGNRFRNSVGSGMDNPQKLDEVLAKHPNTVVISGHSHSDLTDPCADQRIQFVSVGNMTDTYTHLNDGCMIWLENPAVVNPSANNGPYITDHSAGVYVEVYKDKILIECRNFKADGEFISFALYQVDLPNADAVLPELKITGEMEDGERLTLEFPDGYELGEDSYFEWYVDGEALNYSDDVYDIEASSNFGGKRIAARYYDGKGNFASALSENVFDSKVVTYDANGGTGEVPASVKVAPNTVYYLDQGGNGNPIKEGKFFIGWSDDPYASVPVTSINVLDSDKTVYAVYSDKPDLQFDTNLSGFTKNSFATAEIVDGKLHVVSTVNDPISNGSGFNTFTAEDYPVFRIKYKTVSGGMDGFFFRTSGKSYAESTHLYLPSRPATQVFTTADGYTVKEFSMTDLFPDYWTGTIAGIRFDVLAGPGEAYVDYFTFSGNAGIYNAALSIGYGETDPDNIGVGSDLYTVESVKWNGNQAIIFIKAAEGYEFPDADVLLESSTVNGNPVDEASVFGDTARLIATVVPCIDFGSGSVAHIKLKNALMDNTVVAALYDADGRLLATKVAENFSADGILNILLGNYSPVTNIVKLFVFKDTASMAPVCEPYIVDLGNLIPDGKADGEECIFGNVSDQIGKVTVSILADTDNRFFAVRPNNNTQQWCYASYDDITYEAGRTYQVDLDIRLAAQGTNTDLAGDFAATINNNIVYADSASDHIKGSKTLKVSDGWQHVSYQFTIPASSTDRSKDAFRVYANPVSSIGVGFDLDNIVVKPL